MIPDFTKFLQENLFALRSLIKQIWFRNLGAIYHISPLKHAFIKIIQGPLIIDGWCFQEKNGQAPIQVYLGINASRVRCLMIQRFDVVTAFSGKYPKIESKTGFYASLNTKKRLYVLNIHAEFNDDSKVKIGPWIIYQSNTKKSLTGINGSLQIKDIFRDNLIIIWQNIVSGIGQAQYLSMKRIFVDITKTAEYDCRTGIQRVVRGITLELLKNRPDGYVVVPVCLDRDEKGWFYQLVELEGNETSVKRPRPKTSRKIEPKRGDIFLGIDLLGSLLADAERESGLFSHWLSSEVRIIFIVHDILPLMFPDKFEKEISEAHGKWLQTTLHVASGLLCVSKSVAADVLKYRQSILSEIKRSVNIGYFHLGADIESSSPTKGIPGTSIKTIKSIKDRPSFLMVGTIEPRKGIDQAISAFEIIWKQKIEINLVIVGKQGWMVEGLMDRIKNHKLLGKRLFHLQGISDEYLIQIYQICSCLLFASEGEGFGLPIIEAVKFKKPLILRDIPVFRELANENAMYFTGLDPSGMASVILDWLKLKENDRVPISANIHYLTWEQSTQQLLKIVLDDNWQFKE